MLGLMVILAATSASSPTARTHEIDPAQLKLGGVRLGASPAEARKALGRSPLRTERVVIPDFAYVYQGMRIEFSGTERAGSAASISSRNRELCTPAGVCPGMPEKALHDAYGTGARVHRASHDIVGYSTPGDACGLFAEVSDGKITELSAYCQP